MSHLFFFLHSFFESTEENPVTGSIAHYSNIYTTYVSFLIRELTHKNLTCWCNEEDS